MTTIIEIEEIDERVTIEMDGDNDVILVEDQPIQETIIVEFTENIGSGGNDTLEMVRARDNKVLGPIDMGGNKIVNIYGAENDNEAVNLEQLNNTLNYVVSIIEGRTLEQARANNNEIQGDINANGNSIVKLRDATDQNEAVPLKQAKILASNARSDANNYTDQTTLEKVRLNDNTIDGPINANGNTLENLPNAVLNQQPMTLAQGIAFLQQANNYTDTVSTLTVRWGGFWDPAGGIYPNGFPGGVKFGYEYEATNVNPVTMPDGTEVENGDIFRARITNPGQTPANWSIGQGNTQQATEARRGTIFTASQVEAQNENTTNVISALTPVSGWQMLARFSSIARVISGVWTFMQSPKIDTLTIGHYLRAGSQKEIVGAATIPAADVAESASRVFLAPTEKAAIATNTTAIATNATEIAKKANKAIFIATDTAYNFASRSNPAADIFDPALTAQIALKANTLYEFEGEIIFNTVSAAGMLVSVALAGTAAVSSIWYHSIFKRGASFIISSATYDAYVSTTAETQINTSVPGSSNILTLRGKVRTGAAGGSLYPILAFSTATAGTTQNGGLTFRELGINTDTHS